MPGIGEPISLPSMPHCCTKPSWDKVRRSWGFIGEKVATVWDEVRGSWGFVEEKVAAVQDEVRKSWGFVGEKVTVVIWFCGSIIQQFPVLIFHKQIVLS